MASLLPGVLSDAPPESAGPPRDPSPDPLPDHFSGSRRARRGETGTGAAGAVSGIDASRLLDELPLGVLILDPDQNLRYANAAHRALLGREARESGIETWLRLGCRTEALAERVLAQWREYVWQKQLRRVFPLEDTAGRLRRIEMEPRLLPDGDLLVTLRDVTEPLQVETALKLREAQFRTVLDRVGTAVALIDRDGRFLETNPAFERLLGYSRTELRRLGVADCVARTDLERLREATLALSEDPAGRAGQEPREADSDPAGETRLDVSFLPREGEPIGARVRVALTTGQSGRLVFTALLVDPAEEASAPGSDLPHPPGTEGRGFLEAAPDLVVLLDRGGQVRERILPTLPWTGPDLSPDWKDRSLRDCWPALAAGAEARIETVIDQGSPASWRFEDGAASGSGFGGAPVYEVRASPCGADQAVLFVSDRSGEAAVPETGELRALAFEHLDDVVLLADPKGRLLDGNAAAGRAFAPPLAELRGSGLARLYAPPDGEAAFNAALSRALTAEGRWEGECPYRRGDGRESRAAVTVFPLFDAGTPRLLVAIHRELPTNDDDGATGSTDSDYADADAGAAVTGTTGSGWWSRGLDLIRRSVELAPARAGDTALLKLRLETRLGAVARLARWDGPGPEGTVPLGELTRQLITEWLQRSVDLRDRQPLRFRIRADDAITADPETALRYALLLGELVLPALASPPAEAVPELSLSLFEGHPRLDVSGPSPAATDLSEAVLRLLAGDLRASLRLEHREGRAHWLVRFPGTR